MLFTKVNVLDCTYWIPFPIARAQRDFPTLFVTIMTGHQKDNIFVLTPLHGCSQKNGFGPKNSFFGPQKGHFGQSGPRNGPPGGQTATYQKTEGIQSYLRIWGTYDPIESDPSDPKKWGLYGCSVKNADFGQF